MRFVVMILLIMTVPMSGLANSPKHISVEGTVIAYNTLLSLVQITFAPSSEALIVRTRPTKREPSRLIQVLYSYWGSDNTGRAGAEELIARASVWRFKLYDQTGCGTLQEAKPLTDVNTGKTTGEPLVVWKLLPGAENEKLPYGERLPCYSLQVGDYKLYSK